MKKPKHLLFALRRFWPEITTIVDAKNKLTITVLAEDVAGAEPNKPEACAVARACVREYKVDAVAVFRGRAYLRQGPHVTRFCVPEKITRELISFDRARFFTPGVYTLLPPSESARLGITAHATGTGTKMHPTANWRDALL